MSGRSPSGVASLRARFEQKGDSTSPPSRGRSPAASIASDTSRPLSKVRTSFVAVEPSGHMGPTLEESQMDGARDAVVAEKVEESNATTNGHTVDQTKTNGNSSNLTTKSDQDKAAASTVHTKVPEHSGPSTVEASKANSDKRASAVEEGTAGVLPSHPENENAVSGGDAPAGKTSGLGSILKGSPFEQEDKEKATAPTKADAPAPQASKPAPKDSAELSKPQVKASKPPKTASGTSGTEASRQMPKPAQPPEPISKQAQPPKPARSSAANVANGELKDAQKPKPEARAEPKAAPPKAVQTEAAPPSSPQAKKSTGGPAPRKAQPPETGPPKPAPAPKTPTTTQSKPPTKVASPKVGSPKHLARKDTKTPTELPLRTSIAAKPTPATAPKPSTSTSTSKPASTPSTTKPPQPSSKPLPKAPAAQPFHKPRPKSPTRPVKLPASATAPTAASAAKLDPAPPSSKPPRRSSTAGRASLPSRPQPTHASKEKEKEKQKKPRASMAGHTTKPIEGGFLERMMRPTQASSSKTHEKVEARSPPRGKGGVVRGRGSGEGGKGKGEREGDGGRKSEGEHDTKSHETGKETPQGDPPIETAPAPPIPAPTTETGEPAKDPSAPSATT